MSLTIGDILKVVAVLQWTDGDIAQNVFSTVITGSGGPFDEADVVDDMLDWVEAMYLNIVDRVSDELDGSEIRVYIYDSVDEDYDEIGSAVWTFNPTDVNSQSPRGVAGLLNCKTADADVNGKKYLPGSTEAGVDEGLWSTGELLDYAAFAVDWVTGFVGATSGASFFPGVWSPTNLAYYAMSGTVIIPTIPAYQRRRKQGVGI